MSAWTLWNYIPAAAVDWAYSSTLICFQPVTPSRLFTQREDDNTEGRGCERALHCQREKK